MLDDKNIIIKIFVVMLYTYMSISIQYNTFHLVTGLLFLLIPISPHLSLFVAMKMWSLCTNQTL